MKLSPDLIAQFVKATNDSTPTENKNDTLTYGIAKKTVTNGKASYTLTMDGGSLVMPIDVSHIASGVAISENGTRVVVLMKNHSATIVSSLEAVGASYTTLDGVQVNLDAIATIKAENAEIKGTLTAYEGRFTTLDTKVLDVEGSLTSAVGRIDDLEASTLTSDEIEARFATIDVVSSTYATIKSLDATNAEVFNFKSAYAEFLSATASNFIAVEAAIKNLENVYADIEFANIGKAAIENLFVTSGLIDNLIIGDSTITGELVGVTIKGDLIEGGTIVADKLVIQGDDGLYYKLNTNGETIAAEQTEYNSLNGSIITAKSITATQISVSDLVAFDATIGGFTITDDSIYSDVKDSDGNTTRGIHLGSDGQLNIGDQSNFIKYYQDEDGSYKLAISAASILYALNGKQYSVADLGQLGEYVHVSTYEGEPCIELGEGDSDFKLIITNTRIIFMEGSAVPAYINNQSLNITKAVIEEEIQQGDFIWKVRANGNLGLMWKGADE